MVILGLGGLLGEAAAALLKDGEVLAAIEESKLTHGNWRGAIPQAAIEECLRLSGVKAAQVNVVGLVRPFARGPESHLHIALRNQFPNAEITLLEHHFAHAASAYFVSGFDNATVLTLDHAGDFRCGARWKAIGDQLQLDREWYYPDSFGRLYGAVTELLGFEAHADEHKVQWQSTAGDDRFAPLFRDILSDSARLDTTFFDGSRTTHGGFSAKFYERLGLAAGQVVPSAVAPHVARGLQKAVEQTVMDIAGDGDNLALAGGLFYNALLVEALERSGRWKNVFVQPVAGNPGTALGAVYALWRQRGGNKKSAPLSLFLGSGFGQEEIKKVLENCKLRFRFSRSNDDMMEVAVKMLGERKIIAWMQGRMEFGPRALGNRSILASPLDPYSTENLNVFIKHREPFRKFAASVPAELADEFFEVGTNARYLATVGRVKQKYRKTFETAILGEDIVRVHVVHEADNPLYHRLLHVAGKVSGLPVLYNTSFNLFGDPLVSTPRDAVRSFYSSGIDALFVGNFVVEK